MSNHSNNKTDIFQTIADSIHHFTSLPVSIWAPNYNKTKLKIIASVGLPESYVKKASLDLQKNSVTGDAFNKNKVQIARDIKSDSRWKYKQQAQEMRWRSAICVPIVEAKNNVIGVISVYTYRERSILELKYILPDFARQISRNIEGDQQKEILKRILVTGEKLESMTQNLRSVLNTIVKDACELIDADCAVIYPYDAEQNKFYDIENLATYGLKQPLDLPEQPRDQGGMAAYIRKTGEVAVNNIEGQTSSVPVTSSFIQREGINAFMGIALKAAKDVLGVLYVDFRVPHIFTKNEKNAIRLFALQAAYALNNARLHQRANSRIATLEKLHEVGASLTSIKNEKDGLKDTLTRIAQGARSVLGADLVDLYQYIQSVDRYILPPIQVGKRAYRVTPKTINQDDVIRKIIKTKNAKYITDAQTDKVLNPRIKSKASHPSRKPFVARENIKSTAAIPLIIGEEEVVGVLFANYRNTQPFQEHQRKLIELFAHEAAIAIWNARLFGGLQKRLQERLTDISVFQQIYEKMYSANQEELMSLIAEKAVQLTGAKYGVLWLADKDKTQLTCAGVAGDKRPASALPKLPLDKKSINGWVMSTSKPYLSNNIKTDSHYRNWYDDARSELAVPLLHNNNVIGTLDVESTSVDNFTDDHIELLKTLANQAAIAIQNSRIIKKLDTLDDVGQALTSTIRLREQEILDLIYKKASGLMDTNNMYIAFYDEQTDIVRFGLAFVSGKRIDIENEPRWQPRKTGKGRTEEIIRTKQPILIATRAEAKEWYEQPGRQEYVGKLLASWIGVPMVVGNKVIGVIATYHPKREYVYSQDDLNVLQSMAIQAAIAIDNSRMFYDVNQRLSALVNFEQEVTSVIHSGESRILELIYKQVSQLMNTKNLYIALYDERTDIIRFGLAFNDGKRVDVPSRKAGKGKTEVIINTKKPLFHSTYIESKAWYSLPEHKEYVGKISSSWLGVPMVVKGKTIGVIATYHLEKEYLYDKNDLEFLQAMANQAAIAIEAARSFSDVQNRIEDLETVNIIAQAISTKVGASDLLQTIVSQLREHLKCTHCAIFFPEKIGRETFLISQYTDGDYAQEIKSRKFKLGKGIAGWCFDNGEAVLLNDAATDPRFEKARAREYDPRSLLVVPVKENDKVIGVISADHNKANGFDEGDLRLVETISGHVSIALEKERSYEQIAHLYQEARSDAIAAKQLATLGTAIAALQHRINNTLNIIIPNIKRLRSRIDVADPTIEEILEIIERNTRYTSNILIRIQTPLQEVESSSVNVNSLLSDIAGSAQKEWDRNLSHPAVKINLNLDDLIPLIQLPVGQISEIIRNLIDNSYRAMRHGGKLGITSKLENNLIYVRIKDTAKGGIPPAIRERLFQKPVPSKEPGHGAGLGLWLSKLMLQGVGGDVTIEETGPTGTTMLIYIPVSAPGKEAAV